MSKFNLHAFADEAGQNMNEQIAALRENGYEGLEIRKIEDKNISELTLEEAKEIDKRMKDAGLCVWSIGSPIGKIKMDADFEDHMDLYKHTLELSAVFGAKAFRLFSFHMEADETAKYEAEVIDRMGRFCEEAKKYDIKICHENEKILYGVPNPIDGYLELPESFTYKGTTYTEYYVADGTFEKISGLTELVIPNSVTHLAHGSLAGCDLLEKLTIASLYNTNLQLLFGYGIGADMDISLREIYLTDERFDLAEKAFFNCDSLEVIHIEGTLQNVGAYAFSQCDGLEEIILADSITYLSTGVFNDTSGLKKVWLPASLENIERNIFYASKDTLKELRTPFLGETAYSLDNCSLNYFFDNYNSVYNYVSKLETLIILGGNINGKGISKSNIVNLTIPVYSQEDIYSSVTDSNSFRDVQNLYFAGTLEDWCHINNEIIDIRIDVLNIGGSKCNSIIFLPSSSGIFI